MEEKIRRGNESYEQADRSTQILLLRLSSRSERPQLKALSLSLPLSLLCPSVFLATLLSQ